ncbi:aspartyl protease family protein [Maricaulis sp. D1M11]|uniref:aspartyl protease family protein n=1 Tax=Maricaulis sp. D1M11 TaxID=3076117 RepID=UPI0039B44743
MSGTSPLNAQPHPNRVPRDPKTARTRRTARIAPIFASAIASLSLATLTPPVIAQRLFLDQTPSGHYALDVMLGQDGPYAFILDTGASHTAIAEDIAIAHGFTPRHTDLADVQSLTTQFEAERFRVERLIIETLPPVDLETVVIPLVPDEPHIVAGLLGADALPGDRLEIDFINGIIDLDAQSPHFADGLFSPDRQLIFARARVRGLRRSFPVMLDTGTAYSLVNPALGREMRAQSHGWRFVLNGVDGRTDADTQTVLVRRLQIGGLCTARVAMLEADLDIFRALDWNDGPAMVIGMDVLRRARVVIDRNTGEVEISPGPRVDDCVGHRVTWDDRHITAAIDEDTPSPPERWNPSNYTVREVYRLLRN